MNKYLIFTILLLPLLIREVSSIEFPKPNIPKPNIHKPNIHKFNRIINNIKIIKNISCISILVILEIIIYIGKNIYIIILILHINNLSKKIDRLNRCLINLLINK